MPRLDLKTKTHDERVAHIIKHPYRIDALAILNERTASIAELSAIMKVPRDTLWHHIKDLHDAGCIEITRSEPRRGANEHYYCASLRPKISDEAWARLTLKERLEISSLVFGAIVAEGLAAIRLGSFDSRSTRHLSWRILSLDEEGWSELTKEKNESLERIETIQARASHRLVDKKEVGTSVIEGAFVFERARPDR